jgi:protocatechuate 3,4-dioxygenase beta subunit
MQHDDRSVGRLLTRREAVKLMGVAGAAALTGWDLRAVEQATSGTSLSCVVRPELTEGPYFVDNAMVRSDIRTSSSTGAARQGVALAVAFNLSQVSSGRCTPLSKAIVHVWQCDALGIYSGVEDPGIGSGDTRDSALRGTLTTDEKGSVRFTTIYPGWYRGRAVHIHFKIRTHATGNAYEYTSQLFFPEQLTDEIHAGNPYATHGPRDTLNVRDMIFREGGDQLVLQPRKTAAGYEAAMDVTLDLSDARIGRPDAESMPGPGRGRGGAGRL